MDFYGKTVVLLGRPGVTTRPALVRELQSRGAAVRRGLTSATDVLAILHGAHALLETGRLQGKLAMADRFGAICLSEGRLLRALGFLPAARADRKTVSPEDLPAKTGLTPEVLRLLMLFDVVTIEAEGSGFQDVVAAREAARLLADGVALAEVVRIVFRMRRGGESSPSHPLAGSKLVRRPTGEFAVRVGSLLADLRGQLLLPLDEAANPSVDDLFDAAEAAEAEGDLARAEALYRRCFDVDKADPIIPFNLSNVLREQARAPEAMTHLRLALARDPDFAEAWYNLSLLLEAVGRRREARRCLETAVGIDDDFPDAVYNLARACFADGDYAAAADHWRHYLDLDPISRWSRKARFGLALCREVLRAP